MPIRRDRHSLRLLLLVAIGSLVGGCAPGEPVPTPVAVAPSVTATPGPAVPGDSMPGSPLAVPVPPGPDFYAVPDPLPQGRPGEIIWAEPVAAPDGAVAWRVLYHSVSLRGDDIAVSGLVVAPDRTPPAGGFPVIAYAHGTTGLADGCAPSRRAAPLSVDNDLPDSLPLPALWEAGYVVAATDYEGLGTPGRHPYLVGGSEGRGVLDIVRAARTIEAANAGGRTIAMGVSQGGHAALFAGEIAPAYAPDIELAGVVALAPGAELAHAATLLMGDQSVVGFAVAIAAGFAAADPEALLERVLTPAALARIDVVDTGCIDAILQAFAGPVRDVIRLEALMEPTWGRLLEENTPGRVRTQVPVFVGQGDADPLVVPALTDALVVRLCAAGTEVTYRRYTGATHGGVVEVARDDVAAWIEDRLAARPLPANDACPP